METTDKNKKKTNFYLKQVIYAKMSSLFKLSR